MLNKYFKIQKEFQKKLYDIDNISDKEKIEITKMFILSAHKELSEVLECFNWKSHRKEDKRFTHSNLNEEIIDVFKYLINICIMWDISVKDFNQTFDDKTMVVEQRYRQEFMKQSNDEKTCAIDLDDVLNEWEKYIVKTFNFKKNKKYVTIEEIQSKTNPVEYSDFKHWWRDCGIKRKIPVKKGAEELTKYLKEKGYRIIIISSRPYREYSRLFPDTIYWLKKNNITFDDLYFEENKHIKILKFFPKLEFMIEDNPKYAKQVAKEGYIVFLLSNKDISKQINLSEEKNVIHVKSLQEIIDILKK